MMDRRLCRATLRQVLKLHWPVGVMCYKHWRDKRLNPSGIRVVSREFPHEPVAMYKDLRCGLPSLSPTHFPNMLAPGSVSGTVSCISDRSTARPNMLPVKYCCGQTKRARLI